MKWLCDDGNFEIEIEADTAVEAAQEEPLVERIAGEIYATEPHAYQLREWIAHAIDEQVSREIP